MEGREHDRGEATGDEEQRRLAEPIGRDPGGHVRIIGETPVKEVELVHLAELRETPDERLVNLPNALTFLRAVLVPVILALLVVGTTAAQWWAFAIFVFAALTDTVDGWVARRWHGVTRWGQLADPVADKILVIGTLAAIALFGTLPWWAVIVIAAREVAVTVLRLQLMSGYDVVVPASAWGKAKTLSQLVAVAAYLLPGVDPAVRLGLLYIAVALTVVSGVDYAFDAGRIIRDSREDAEA